MTKDVPDNAIVVGSPAKVVRYVSDATGDTNTPDSYMTQVRLAEGIEPNSDVTDEFRSHQTVETHVNELVHDAQEQDRLLTSHAEQTACRSRRKLNSNPKARQTRAAQPIERIDDF